jgi:membrane-bound lytic murein transglycosylase A
MVPRPFLPLLALTLLLAGCATAPRHDPAAAVPSASPASTACPPCVCPQCPGAAEAKPTAAPTLVPATFADLPGWNADDVALAWSTFLGSCRVLRTRPAWQGVCDRAAEVRPEQVRGFLEANFRPYRVANADGTTSGLVTGYFEPLLRGSRTRRAPYLHALYAPPDDLLVIDLAEVNPDLKSLRLRGRLDGNRVVPYWSRADIERGRAKLAGKELVWVDDPLEAFFLQVQGSGRVQLDGGEMLRVGYADQNGHPYRAIGRWLVDRGELTVEQASMQGIAEWARRNPKRLNELLDANPSYVFFRVLPNANSGPPGSLGVPLTPQRSIAVDPKFVPLGAPVWLATTDPGTKKPLERLVIAQDTGGAIRGAVRADYFWGFGAEAGRQAGRMREQGRLWVLLPNGHPVTNGEAAAR